MKYKELTVKQKTVLLESLTTNIHPKGAATIMRHIEQQPIPFKISLNAYKQRVTNCLKTDMVKDSKLLTEYFNRKLHTINSIIQNL